MGQASIFGGKGLLRALIVALQGGCWRQGGGARAGWRGQPRASPVSRLGEWRRWWLLGDALKRAGSNREAGPPHRNDRFQLISACCTNDRCWPL